MKKGSIDSHQLHGCLQNLKFTHKYKLLLEDYLVLQKVFVSKKKKLQVEKQKREILLDEVRFLRQRLKYLTKLKFAKVEPELNPQQNVDINDVSIEKDINYVANQTNTKQEGNEMEELMWKPESTKKPMNFIDNAKKSGKKKVSWWIDEVTLFE